MADDNTMSVGKGDSAHSPVSSESTLPSHRELTQEQAKAARELSRSSYRHARWLGLQGWVLIVIIGGLIASGVWAFFEVPRLVLGDFQAANQARVQALETIPTVDLQRINGRYINRLYESEILSRLPQDLPANLRGRVVSDLEATRAQITQLGLANTIEDTRAATFPKARFDSFLSDIPANNRNSPPILRVVELYANLEVSFQADRDRKIELLTTIQRIRSEASTGEANTFERLVTFQVLTNLNRFGFLFIVIFVIYLTLWMYRYKVRVAGHYRACGDALKLLAEGLLPASANALPEALQKVVAGLSPAAYDIGKPPKTVFEHLLGAASAPARRAGSSG